MFDIQYITEQFVFKNTYQMCVTLYVSINVPYSAFPIQMHLKTFANVCQTNLQHISEVHCLIQFYILSLSGLKRHFKYIFYDTFRLYAFLRTFQTQKYCAYFNMA